MSHESGDQTRLKVLFITKWYPNRYDPQMGVYIRKHATAVATFCDVAVLHVYSDEKLEKKKIELVAVDDNSIKSVVVYFKTFTRSFSLANKVVNLIRYWKATMAGLKYIRKNFGDHNLTHAYILLRPAIVAYCFHLFRKKPFLISEQWSGYATGKYESRNPLIKYLSRFIIRKAGAVTVVSEFLKNHMLRNGLKGNYYIIPNIVELPLRQFRSPVHSKVKILVVADLVDEIKNVSGILNAIKEIVATTKNLELHIIGDGVDRKNLVSLASELKLLDQYVHFHGLKSNEEVYESIQDSDFLVMNSNFETFSLICAEAISCGKPVVATRCGGPQEFITDETGILIDPGSHQQLVLAIQKMLAEFRTYSPEKLMLVARNKFSSQIATQKFKDAYRSILQEKSF